MKKALLIGLISISFTGFSQTLFVPGGTLGNSTNGFVGIGLNNPTHLLSIKNTSGNGTINLKSNGFSSYSSIILNSKSGSNLDIFSEIKTVTNHKAKAGIMKFSISNEEGLIGDRMELDYSGNLSLFGWNNTNLTVGSNGNSSIASIKLNSRSGTNLDIFSEIRTITNNKAHGGIMEFRISDEAGNLNKRMSLDHSSTLTVAGKVHSREVKVTVDAGADFVFEESYELRTL